MGSKHLGADVNLAWPTAQIAVIGAQGAVGIMYRKELAAAEDPDARARELIAGVRGHLRQPVHRRRARLRRRGHPAVRTPARRSTKALRLLRTKRETLPPKKHGNIPL